MSRRVDSTRNSSRGSTHCAFATPDDELFARAALILFVATWDSAQVAGG
jgi:hypothetical protein